MKTRLTLKSGQDGTIRLVDKYGDALVCIRFRYDVKNGKRLKTVELIVYAIDWSPPPLRYVSKDIFPLRKSASNMCLLTMVKAVSGRWKPEEQLCFVKFGSIAGGPLENHIHIYGSVKLT
jgi:hypothetical protein